MVMTVPDANSDLGTHRVENQPMERGDEDLLEGDPALLLLLEYLSHENRAALTNYAVKLGARAARLAAVEANRNSPELILFDRGGRRLDEVRFHPSYHGLMETSQAAGYAALAWEGRDDGHLTHAAMVYLASQVEPGHCCPLTMTYAATPALKAADAAVTETWRQKILSRRYDPTVRPIGEKAGATLGMALTEKQGGSDVRTNTTRAERDGDAWRLTGHKWFCSAPMSDGFLTLAQAPGGLTCFLVPRWLDGSRNDIRLMRLKDKLGNRSNASAEIEYDRAFCWQVGDEGDGVRAIIPMIHHTRLDTAMAPVGLMRAALAEAHHWVAHRTAFEKRLIDQPLMRVVLADLGLDLIGSLALGLRVARAYDGDRPEDRALARIGVALAKYMSNKLCPAVICEAMEILGGAGYVEDGPIPLLYREAPLNGIWEGSGNVICLDALRTLAAEPLARDVLAAELDAALNLNSGFDRALRDYRDIWRGQPGAPQARAYTEQTALLLTASILLRTQMTGVAEEYVSCRLSPRGGRTHGAMRGLNPDRILSTVFAEPRL